MNSSPGNQTVFQNLCILVALVGFLYLHNTLNDYVNVIFSPTYLSAAIPGWSSCIKVGSTDFILVAVHADSILHTIFNGETDLQFLMKSVCIGCAYKYSTILFCLAFPLMNGLQTGLTVSINFHIFEHSGSFLWCCFLFQNRRTFIWKLRLTFRLLFSIPICYKLFSFQIAFRQMLLLYVFSFS